MQRGCDLNISRWITDSYHLINAGPVFEQFVGQEKCANSNFKGERLYFWGRDKRGSSAEVDYMVEHAHGVSPVEVKAGASGRLKSMHLLLDTCRDLSEGIKVSLDNFEKKNNIQSIPLYAFGSWLHERRFNYFKLSCKNFCLKVAKKCISIVMMLSIHKISKAGDLHV